MTPKHRLFVRPDQIAGDRVRFDPAQAHQLARVLRLRPGDRLTVLDGADRQAIATLDRLTRDGALARLDPWEPRLTEPVCRITLYQALIKLERFEWVLQKGTEIGVAAFVPLRTDRCLSRGPIDARRIDRWRTIIREAAEQSGRARLPTLGEPAPIADLPDREQDLTIVCWEAARDRRLRDCLAGLPQIPTRIGLIVGPEGGLTEAETGRLAARGAPIAGLGPRILRAETAALAAATIVLTAAGDLG